MNDESRSITMLSPPHPGGLVRDNVEASGWTVTEAAENLGIGRQTLSRLLNGRSGVSPSMALALERIGWSNAFFWMRLQAAWELARERKKQAA